DMNRAWPSGWQPPHVQFGAGPYPLHWPETRLVADFILSKPNIAAAQSFHNSGGMILIGPGYQQYGSYPSADQAVYDALAEDGEAMLPHYDFLVIWEDLYSVYGGFVNWTYEGLGILSFTNELWTGTRNSPDGRIDRSTEGRHRFDDLLLMSAGFRPWTEVEHPTYGTVEVGGFTKDVGRVPPSFLLEEELHRNALFCVRHAEAMPEVAIDAPQFEDLGGGLVAIDVVVRNLREIPSRTAMAARERIGLPDVFELEGPSLEVVAAGERTDRFRPERIQLVDGDPARIVREEGVSRGDRLRLRYLVRGTGEATLRFRSDKARDVERRFSLP
ncbi:MAG: M14 family zinc carboxypeptidase, partial [Planctomycetota bacterium]